MTRILPLALFALLLAIGATAATVALRTGEAAPAEKPYHAFAPGLAGDSAEPFPTIPVGAEACKVVIWTYQSTLGPPDTLLEDGITAWWANPLDDDPVANFDLTIPEAGDDEVIIIVEFLGEDAFDSHPIAIKTWPAPGGHYRQVLRADKDRFRSLKQIKITICRVPRKKSPSGTSSLQSLSPNVVRANAAPGQTLVGPHLLVQPSPGDALFGASPLVVRPNNGDPIPGGTTVDATVPGDFSGPMLTTVNGVDVVLPPAQIKLVDTFKYDNNRTGFIVQVTEPQTTWKPTVSLKFPNNFNPGFAAPTILYAGEPRFFSLIVPDNLTGTFTLPQVVPAITGGSGYGSAPDGAKMVYGQPQVEWVPGAEDWSVRVPLCNPLDRPVTLTNAGIDAWRLGADGNPDLLLTGTMTDTLEPGECAWKELLRQAARTRGGTIPPAPSAIPPGDGWTDYYSAGGPSIP